MLILVTGGSGSGKSAYAERRVVELGEGSRVYLATMNCSDEESRQRVKRHRAMRQGKEFITLEQPLHLKQAQLPGGHVHTVLLECLSNLAANEMFDPAGSGERAYEEILEGIEHIRDGCDHLVIVSNEIFSDGVEYDPYTTEYIRLLGRLNQALGKMADEVVESVYGIPVKHK